MTHLVLFTIRTTGPRTVSFHRNHDTEVRYCFKMTWSLGGRSKGTDISHCNGASVLL